MSDYEKLKKENKELKEKNKQLEAQLDKLKKAMFQIDMLIKDSNYRMRIR